MRKLTLLLVTALLAQAQKALPPPPTAPRTYPFPRTVSKVLPNGLKVFVVEDHRQPLVSAVMEILAGGAYNTPDKAGLANITASLLRQGTATRNAQEIARLVDNAGGSLAARAGDDVATVDMTFMRSSAALGMELMADIVRNPTFPQAEMDRLMRQAQSILAAANNDPATVAHSVGARAILGTHPYAYPDIGTPQTLRSIQREEIVAFYKATYAPGRAWMAIAGDTTPVEAFAMAEKYFGSWPAAEAPDVKLPAPPAPKPQILIVDMPGAVQTRIVVGHVGIARNHPDYVALFVANQIFGGSGLNSRMNSKLRGSEGLTYDASSVLEPNRQTGFFRASTATRTEKTADTIRAMLDLYKEFRQNPATETEFNEVKGFVIGSFALSTETAASVASLVLRTGVFGLPEDYYTTYSQKIQALTREQMTAAVRNFLQPENLSIVAVGNAKEFAKQLEAFGTPRIIRNADLDLVAPNLTKEAPKVVSSVEGGAKARALVDAAISALGGKDKLMAIKDQTLNGKLKLTLPQGSMEADSEEQVLYPDRYRMVLKLPMGVMTQTLDGNAAWMAQGAQIRDLPANLAAELSKSVPICGGGVGMLQAVVSGQATVQPVSDSAVTWKSGDFEAQLSFDPASHQLVKINYKGLGMSGPADLEVTYGGFMPFQGLTVHTVETTSEGANKVSERTILERKVNSGLRPDDFKKR